MKIKRLFTLFFIISLGFLQAQAYEERNLLQERATYEQLKESLIMNQQWVTFPDYSDRNGWDAYMGSLKDTFIELGEKYLDYEWKIVKATDYLEFERSGKIEPMGNPFDSNNRAMITLLLAELAEGKGRFIDQLIDGTFHICEMTSWTWSAHTILQPSKRALPTYDWPVFDLTDGDLGNIMSWTHYFMHKEFDKVDPEISRRLRHEIQYKVMDPYLNDNSLWWMGRLDKNRMQNNWNPWCNSNALLTFMLMENDRDTLAKAVYLTMQSVDVFFGHVKGDGACEEGPSYWGHAAGKVLDYLEMLSLVTGGKVNLFDHEMIKRMGDYISASYVGNGWVVNFADASAKGGGDAYLIYRYGKNTHNSDLMSFAAMQRKPNSYPFYSRDFYRTIVSIGVHDDLFATKPGHSTKSYIWYPETQFCYFSNPPKDIFVAAKGGHNNESHNHNDVGTANVYFDQTPVLIDIGVENYTRKTFSSERYTIWTMQSNYHNLPAPNGVAEKEGGDYKSSDIISRKNFFSVNIAGAYPKEAGVQKWIRSYSLQNNQVTISDAFILNKVKAPNLVNFMTWGTIEKSGRGQISIKVDNVKALMSYNEDQFDLSIEPIKVTDSGLLKIWGDHVYRLSFKAKELKSNGNYRFVIKKM